MHKNALKSFVEVSLSSPLVNDGDFISQVLEPHTGKLSKLILEDLTQEVKTYKIRNGVIDMKSKFVAQCISEGVKLNCSKLGGAETLNLLEDSIRLLEHLLTKASWGLCRSSQEFSKMVDLTNLVGNPTLEEDEHEIQVNTIHWLSRASKTNLLLLTNKQESSLLTEFIDQPGMMLSFIEKYHPQLSTSQIVQLISIHVISSCAVRRT